MRKLFSLLNLLLCFELVVSPFAPGLSLMGDKAYAETCQTGFTYDSVLNRCLTKTETANVMNATASCNGDVECYKRNAQDAFQKELDAGKGAKSVKDNQFVSNVANIAAVAGPVTILAAGVSKSQSACTSASFWAMVGGSVALFVGDNLANFQHKKRLKDIKKDWGKIVSPDAGGDKDKEKEISMEAQSQAFEMLARSEESLAKAAKMKKNFFTVAALAYGVSGVIAGLEIIAETNPFTGVAAKLNNTCAQAKPSPGAAPAAPAPTAPGTFNVFLDNDKSIYASYLQEEKPFLLEHQFHYNLNNSSDLISLLVNKQAMSEKHASPSIDYYLSLKETFKGDVFQDSDAFEIFKGITVAVINNLNPFPKAMADESNASKAFKESESKGSNPLITGAVGAVGGYFAGKALMDKASNLTTSAIGRTVIAATLTGLSTIMAMHAGKQAEASTKRAELLRQMRDEFQTAYGAIHNCKSEDRNDPGKPECYCYTPENKKNPNRGSSKICTSLWAGISTKSGNYSALSSNSKVCINKNNQADATCACKSNNTCMKVSLSGVKGLNQGSFSMLSNSLDPLNKIASGSIDGASVDTSTMANQAAKLKKMTEQLEKNKALAASKKNRDKTAKSLMNGLTTASSQLPPNSLLGSSGGLQMPSNPGEAARMLEKELEDKAPITTVGGGQGLAASSPTGDDFQLEFGLTEDGLATQESQLAEVMNQDLDYGGNDINEGSKANIFEVLSNRYQRSGMRRLFDEKGTTKADKAEATDITQK